MRIPSDLNPSPLYGRSRRRGASPGQSWRRVLRLCIVLGLVLVVMRQAARPGVYAVFFPSEMKQVDFNREAVGGKSRLSGGEALARDGDSPISEATIDSLRDDVGRQLEAIENSPTIESDEANEDSDQFQSDVEFLLRFLREPPSSDAKAIARAIWVQRRLIAHSRDGNVWRADDMLGLTGTIAMHRMSSPAARELQTLYPARSVAGVLPLLQQPKVYRGKGVVAGGKLVRLEKISAAENPFGVQVYWNLWLQPEDASGRPWLMVVGDLPEELVGLTRSDDQSAENWDVLSPLPQVRIHGEYLKRLSYQSQSGAQLTPVVVGHVKAIRANGNGLIEQSLVEQSRRSDQLVASAGARSATRTQSDDGVPNWRPLAMIMGAVFAGIALAVSVMWRTRTFNRQLRERRAKRDVSIGVVLVCLTMMNPNAHAESLLDLLPGFDTSRLQSTVESSSDEGLNADADEAAKLIFRLKRLSPGILKTRLNAADTSDQSNEPAMDKAVVGEPISINGEIVSMQNMKVSSELSEMLNLPTVTSLRVRFTNDTDYWVLSSSLSPEARPGDRIAGIGVRLAAGVVASGNLRWLPKQPVSPAHAVLSGGGIDLSELSQLSKLDRSPLVAADSSIFFRMIGVADRVTDASTLNKTTEVAEMRQAAISAQPIDLLKDSSGLAGQWIWLDLETVRITKVFLESPERRSEVGQDAYFQIDAIGDLGNVQLKIEVPNGDPIVMDNRYPVTIVTAKLPNFLRAKTDDSTAGGESLVLTSRIPVRVEGFYYRLWSYESDLMKSRGGKQFAPLIIAGELTDRRSKTSDPIGVGSIGTVAAVCVLLGITAIVLFGLVTRKGDKASRRRRYDEPIA
ncbi:MAG: hypothetical protein AB8B91_22010 [Rubripirellula sp.]